MTNSLETAAKRSMTISPNGGATWLAIGTECGALIAARDWSATPLGPIIGWPSSLKTMLGFVLHSRVPIVMLWGPSGVMLYNDAYSVFAGARHPGLLGKHVREGWPEVADFNDNVMRVGLAGGTLSYKGQELTLYRHGEAEQVFMDLDYSPVPGDDGEPAGVLAVVIETTERVKAERLRHAAEAALTAERDRARGVLENMAEGFVLLDHEFRVVDINAEGIRLEQRSRDELIGKTQCEAWPDSRDSEVGSLCRRAMAERVPGSLEHHYRWGDGHDAWLDMRAYPTADGLALFYKDVSDKRRAIELAADAAERVELALTAGAIVGTWVWYVPTDHFIADARFAASFGLDPALCRSGLPLDQVTQSIHEADRHRVAAAIADVLRRGGSYRCEYRVRQHDRIFRWVEANGRVELGPDGSALRFPGVLLDIDTRRATEAERDRATAMLRIFAEAVPGVVYAKDREGRMLVANRGTTELIGKPPADYLGRTDEEVLDDKAQARAVMATDQRIMASGKTEQIEEEVRLADGRAAFWLSTKAPLLDDAGKVIGLVGSSVDITDRIKAERALEEALKTSDVLLHEVNHRVKNSLQIVTSLLVLQAGQAKDPALRQSLMEARGRISVIAAMHQRLYSTSQHDRVDFGDYLRELADETLNSLGGTDRIRFDTRIEPGIVVMLSQAVPLALVVSELLTNALKYAFPDGRTGSVLLALERDAEALTLVVADDGVGLPDGFDPSRKGGLGMRIVNSLVRQVRGTLTVPRSGRGSVFRISIPLDQIL